MRTSDRATFNDTTLYNDGSEQQLALQVLVAQVSGLCRCWQSVLDNQYSAEEFTAFSRLLHEVGNLSEEHHYFQVYELVSEMESTALALGRRKGAVDESVEQYLSSCVNTLELLVGRLSDKALTAPKADKPQLVKLAPRVYFFDEHQGTSKALAMDMKGHGYQVLSFRSMDDLSHAMVFREPIVVMVFLNNGERLVTCQDQQDMLLSVMALSNGQVPCIAVGLENDWDARAAAAKAGVNSFYAEPIPRSLLVSELFSLRKTADACALHVLLMCETEDPALVPLERTLLESRIQVTRVSRLEVLIDELLAPQIGDSIDGVVFCDQGDESLLRQSLALLRQDILLEEIPLFVVTINQVVKTSIRNVHYSEHFSRLISMSTSGCFTLSDSIGSSSVSPLIFAIQVKGQRYRHNRALSLYRDCLEPESGSLTKTGFYRQSLQVLSSMSGGDQTAPMMVVVQVNRWIQFIDTAGLTSENGRRCVIHGLLSLLSPMDRVTALADDKFAMFLARSDQQSKIELMQKIEQWFLHFCAQYVEREDIQVVMGNAIIVDSNLHQAMRSALAAVHWKDEQSSITKDEAVATFLIEPSDKPDQVKAPKETTLKKSNWPFRVKQAIKAQRLSLVYQPVVSLEMDKEERYEVLLRLTESGEVILPSHFLSTIKEVALINYIDRWVIATALKELNRSNRLLSNESVFFIKAEPSTFFDRSFLPWLEKALEMSQVQPSQCVFELSEQQLLESFAESQDAIRRLRELGVKVCVAQVGPSKQSLALLDYFEFDFIKLHRCFVLEEADRWGGELCSLILKARQHKVVVMAGFVENPTSLMALIQKGVGLISGEFLQPPEAVRQFDFSIEL